MTVAPVAMNGNENLKQPMRPKTLFSSVYTIQSTLVEIQCIPMYGIYDHLFRHISAE